MNKRIRKKRIKKLAIAIYNSNYVWCAPDVAIALASNYMFPTPKDKSSISEWNGIPITQSGIINDRLEAIHAMNLAAHAMEKIKHAKFAAGGIDPTNTVGVTIRVK